jgi:SnoaL-like protein
MEDHHVIAEVTRAFEARDADALAACLAEDVDLDLMSSGAPLRGREQAREWYRQSFEQRFIFEAHSRDPVEIEPGSYLLEGRLRVYEDHTMTDRPGRWVITIGDGFVTSIRRAPT